MKAAYRVPLVAAWAKPDVNNELQKKIAIPAGAVEDDIVTCTDMMPTLVSIGGATIPKDSIIDGKDITPYFKGIPGTHRPQRFLAHFPHRHTNTLFSTYREGNWKIIYTYQDKKWELYNISIDISEKHDLVEGKPQLALLMAKRLIANLDSHKTQYPLDAKTGKPVKPRLALLNQRAKKKNDAPQPEPLSADTLNLNAKIQPITDENIYRDEGFYTWCNSIIKGDAGKYHLFYVRWPKEYGFYSWLTHSEIARAISDNPAGPFKFVEKVIPSRGEFAWNKIDAHNVKIKRFNGKFYLYFIATNDSGKNLTEEELIATARRGYRHPNWPVLRNNQRTGVAVADSIAGPWRILDKPVIEPDGPISTVTVNPAIWQSNDGKFKMIIKGDHPPRVVQALGLSDKPEGPFLIQPKLVFESYSEDVSVWHDPQRKLDYAILHDTRGFGMLVSPDGTKWQNARNFRVTGKQVKRKDGTMLKASRFERPAVYAENGIPKVLSAAVQTDGGKDAFIVTIPLAD